MTDTTSKTYKFSRELFFTYLSPRHLANKDGKRFYARLAKGEDSIVEKEQSEFAKPYRIYVDGEYKTITDKLEQEFLESSPSFGRDIMEYNPAAESQKRWEEIDYTTDVIVKVKTLDATEARGLGYRLFGRSALSENLTTLKAMLVSEVNEDAKKVDEILEEKSETDFALIGLAMAKDVISEAEFGTKVVFTDTNEVITNVRKGERPIDALADLFASKEGRELKAVIYQKLQPKVVDEITEKVDELPESKPAAKGRPTSK